MMNGQGHFLSWAFPLYHEPATMTEAEWFSCSDPQLMLEFLLRKASPRKLRFLGCALLPTFLA